MLSLYFEWFDDSSPYPSTTFAFLISLLVCLALALLLRWIGRKGKGSLYRREALLIVVIIWFLTGIVAALPFTLSGSLRNPLDAYFEVISGLTTTGASVITGKVYDSSGKEIPIETTIKTDPPTRYTYYGTIAPIRDASGEIIRTGVEALPPALLFWRSFLNWLGGMGIVVLFLAILPALGVGGKLLYQAEVPGPVKDSFTPRIRGTASLLWKIYILLSVLQVVLMVATNDQISLFHSILVTFATISTGGFTPHNSSIGAYITPTTQWIVCAFMVVGGLNFAHYVHLIRRKISRLWEPELVTYFVLLILFSAFVSYKIFGTPQDLLTGPPTGTYSLSEAIRYGTFNLVSCQTCTGFATANFDLWPFATQVLLLTAMFVGGMSGSTAGGIKVVRQTMFFKIFLHRVEAVFRPNAVRAIRVGHGEIAYDRALTVCTFIIIVIGLALIGTFLLVVDGVDPQTSLSVNACMLNNVGLAFRAAGPEGTFAFLTPFGKSLSIFYMVLGRLEYFAILILFLPSFWRSK
ncbi:MAG: TrkH family potassium uptake protein [Parachlamydiales bacterium]